MTALSRTKKNRAAAIAAMALQVTGLGTTSTAPDTLPPVPPAPLVGFRSYQLPVFLDHSSKVLMLEWSRQIGKSYVLGNWCIDRLLRQLARHKSWTIVVLSNSKDNGSEFAIKCAEAARRMGEAVEDVEVTLPDSATLERLEYEEMRFQVTIRIGNRVGRVLILAANPRTARGFSGDLVMDEFAFHEDAAKIWEAAEPIISANPEFLCRIASTHNGKNSLFNQMLTATKDDGTLKFVVNSVRRSDAWAAGELKISSLSTGAAITPEQAEAESMDRRAYRQNYENEPSDEAGALIPMELIVAAQRAPYFAVDEQEWSASTIARLHRMDGEFSIGQDVARTTDLSVVDVLCRMGAVRREVAQLVMRNLPLSHQRRQMQALMSVIGHRTRRVSIDSTGLGTGLVDELTDIYGSLIIGCNFSATVPVTPAIAASGRKAVTMGLPERLALDLLSLFEDRVIEIQDSREMRDDLRKPGRVVSADGKRVSIAATRGTDGHADRFWALALAEHGFRESAWGAFDADSVGSVVTGGGSFAQTPWITSFEDVSNQRL